MSIHVFLEETSQPIPREKNRKTLNAIYALDQIENFINSNLSIHRAQVLGGKRTFDYSKRTGDGKY